AQHTPSQQLSRELAAAGSTSGTRNSANVQRRPSAARKRTRPGRVLYLAVNIAVLTFLLAPIAIVVVFALNPTPFIQFPPVGVSLRWFHKFFAARDFMHAIGFSLEVAVLTTACATVLGGCAALAIARGNLPGARVVLAVML